MTRQAQVGAFAIVALLLLFGIFYVITDFGTRHTGYRIGVHFKSAAGLTPGALVYFSGVNVGSVDSIALLPDNTVDVILAVRNDIDVPAASRFLIDAPLTGAPQLVIVPPAAKPPLALLPRQVLPVDQQPQGTNATSVQELLEQGQGELRRFDEVMADLQRRTPRLLDTLQSTLDHANELTISANDSVQTLMTKFVAASENIEELSSTLNATTNANAPKLAALLDGLEASSVSLNKSMTALQGLATDPRLKKNLIDTTQSVAVTTENLARLTGDLRNVTGDPQTQAQMRNTIANLDATMQRANSLLGELGGTSNVYGVDANATPPPAGASPNPAAPGGAAPPASTGMSPAMRAKLQNRMGAFVRNLINVQVRLSGLSPQQNAGFNSVLPHSQGPLGDINVVVLPHATTSLMFGANAIGTKPTWNALLEQSKGNFQIGGGVLYSQMGALARYNWLNGFGLETRVYDLTYPMIDLYGNFRIAPGTTIFFGQRAINHSARRNTAGLQYQF
ncbi:MAG: MCE family protein [Candidatus Eremiobacteraeota bacterium]|nr:MCE family protein [Candidatus Eremiobacteraeota bacterium]